MRTLAQAGLLPTVLRLSDETETAINLADPPSIGGADDPGCLMITGYEGTAEQVDARARRRDGRAHRTRRHRARRGARAEVGARPVRRALPPRLAARPRRARRDAGDGDLLVQPRRGCTPTSRPRCRPRSARARSCCATSRTSTRPAARSTSPSPHARPTTRSAQWQVAKAAASDAIDRRRRHHHPPPRRRHRPQAVVRPGDRRRSACGCCVRSRRRSTRPGSSTRACSSPDRTGSVAAVVQRISSCVDHGYTGRPAGADDQTSLGCPKAGTAGVRRRPRPAARSPRSPGPRGPARRRGVRRRLPRSATPSRSTAPVAANTCWRGSVGQRDGLTGRQARHQQAGASGADRAGRRRRPPRPARTPAAAPRPGRTTARCPAPWA